jgi:N-carbamoyl-L-amino-acid hydrolase
MTLAEIGATPAGGVCRLALSDEDLKARDLFVGWCRDAGLTVRIDDLGNIFARRNGTDPDSAPVLSGSHLDSQPLGGRFDGAYGVMAALEMVRSLNDANVKTRRPIDIVAWTNEEGSRFPAGCMGSSVFAGRRDKSAMLDMADAHGKSVRDELKRIGYDGADLCGEFPVSALFEVHIEQGPILERSSNTIGVVGGAQGLRCYQVEVTGTEGHAGTLPMDQRQDAFQGAARMAVALDELVAEFQPRSVITVGVVDVGPGSRNTIPGSVQFSIDCRCPEEQGMEQLEASIHSICSAIAKDRNLELGIELVTTIPPVKFDKDCIESVRSAAIKTGLPHCDILSGAGHDACHISTIAPVGMIFIPCKDGISHNEIEYASPEGVAAGCQVLLGAVYDYANR